MEKLVSSLSHGIVKQDSAPVWQAAHPCLPNTKLLSQSRESIMSNGTGGFALPPQLDGNASKKVRSSLI